MGKWFGRAPPGADTAVLGNEDNRQLVCGTPAKGLRGKWPRMVVVHFSTKTGGKRDVEGFICICYC